MKTLPLPLAGRRLALVWFVIPLVLVTPTRAQLMVVAERGMAPVTVDSATIRTEVTGRIAVTTFDLLFRNPNDRVLEGTFEFPLLDGQKIVRFALDVNGRLREAVPVEKDRGRVVFEEIERHGVDPGLLEQAAGNCYRARVYPIPARGFRRVVIAYQEDVRRGGSAAYRLALDFPTPLKTFQLAITAYTGSGEPPKATTTLPLSLPEWRDAKQLTIDRTDFTARGVIDLELPPSTAPAVVTQRRGNEEYFYAELPLADTKPAPRPAPRVLGLIWDASGSGRNRDHTREFALLDAWFAAVPNVDVSLVAIRDHAAAPVRFTVKGADWSKLKRALEHIVYDGATSFDGLADEPDVGEWMLFSDGFLNYGTAQSAAGLHLHGPIQTVAACARSDTALLRGLASHSGGEFVDLLQTSPGAAAARLRARSLRVLAVQHDPEELAEVFPEPNTAVGPDGLVITGKLRAKTATLSLRVGHDAADAETETLVVNSGENPSELVARAWAGAKIGELEIDRATNEEDIKRTAKEFGIVTANTSLIVLETLQDYERYDIEPPADLRPEWEANRSVGDIERRKDRVDHLDEVARLFEQKVRWWERAFPKDSPRLEKEPIDFAEPTVDSAGQTELARTDAGTGRSQEAPMQADHLAATDEPVVMGAFSVAGAARARFRAAAESPSGNRLASVVASMPSLEAPPAPAKTDADPSSQATPTAGAIVLRRWEPSAGYLDRLKRAGDADAYGVYLEERATHLNEPGFFLDSAGYFFGRNNSELGLRILSNLAELQLDDPAVLRVLAHRLVEVGHPELAQPLFERVLVLRPEEPQSHRDLALVCAERKEYQRAVDLLWEVVSRRWDARFPEIELIALGELNAIIATCGEQLDVSAIDPRLRQNLAVGLRVVLTWDTDNCDIDLWVDDPNGERAMYNHPLTYQGGRMSRDFTGGYGPEEFLLRAPKAGKYTVRINYYGDRRQTALGPVTAQVRLISGFGTAAQTEKRLTVRLKDRQETIEIGNFDSAAK